MTKRWRVITRVVVFLLLGAIVNVAVAWGCVVWSDTRPIDDIPIPVPSTGPTSKPDLAWLHRNGWRKPDPHPVYGGYFCETVAPECSGLTRLVYLALPDTRYKGGGFSGKPSWHTPIAQRLLAGLPCAALQSSSFDEWRTSVPVKVDYGAGPVDVEDRLLPHRPIWPGFAINTIFYATILALLFYAPGKVRRMVRVRRSQCPACGHIIAAGTCANGLCSECGSPLPKGFKPKPEARAKP